MGDAPRDPAIAELPPVLAAIAETIGLGAALKLAATWGGVQISVPAGMKADHVIAKLIGLEAGKALHRLIVEQGLGDGLRRIEIPRAHAMGSAAKRREVRAAIASGMSKRQAALHFGMTNRAIRRICNGRLGDDVRQGELF